MRTAILHPGMHKTGSSSNQNTLCAARAALREQGVEYFELGRPNPSGQMVCAFADPGTPMLLRTVGAATPEDKVQQIRQKSRRRIRRRLARSDARLLILSAEGLAHTGADGRARLIRMLQRAGFDRVLVRGYLRPPKSQMESRFHLALRAGATPKVGGRGFPNYRAHFEGLVADPDAVAVRLFAPSALTGGCVVRDFAAWTGVDLADVPPRRDNTALSLTAARLLYCHNAFNAQARPAAALVRALEAVPGPRFRLHPDTMAQACEANRAEIDWAEARLGAPLLDLDTAPREGVRSAEELLALGAAEMAALADLAAAAGLDRMPPAAPEPVAALLAEIGVRLPAAAPSPG